MADNGPARGSCYIRVRDRPWRSFVKANHRVARLSACDRRPCFLRAHANAGHVFVIPFEPMYYSARIFQNNQHRLTREL